MAKVQHGGSQASLAILLKTLTVTVYVRDSHMRRFCAVVTHRSRTALRDFVLTLGEDMAHFSRWRWNKHDLGTNLTAFTWAFLERSGVPITSHHSNTSYNSKLVNDCHYQRPYFT
jgi:hypothetical protein